MLLTIIRAISFLLTLRLRQTNLPNYIRTNYDSNAIKLFYSYGNTIRKQEKAKLDIEFLKKCKIFNVTPKFVRFKLYRKALHQSTFYKSWQAKLLMYEISSRRKSVTTLEHKKTNVIKELHSIFSLRSLWHSFYATSGIRWRSR